MYDFLIELESSAAKIPELVAAKPEIFASLVNATGFVAGIYYYLQRTKAELKLQHRNNYFGLELEASRIFTVAVQNPDIPRYLRGELDQSEKGKDRGLKEQVFWFVSQELNIFEIAISLRNDRTITSELFATWVPWFYELGTYGNFREFWTDRPYDLMYNYKQELQDVMTAAIELRLSPDFDEDDPRMMERFCGMVAEIFKDPAILAQYRRTKMRNERLEARLKKTRTLPQRKSLAPALMDY